VKKGATGGFTLLELMIALAVLAVGILGGFSTVLVVRRHNQATADLRHAYRACQQMMDLVLTRKGPADSQGASTSEQWKANWDGRLWEAVKDGSSHLMPPEWRYGTVRVEPVSNPDPAEPALPFLYKVTVSLKGQSATLQPLNVELVTWTWKGALGS